MTPRMNLARWLPHLAAARRQGKTVAAYAAEHGLSRHTLYTAARVARATGAKSPSQANAARRRETSPSAFAAVRLVAPLAAPELPPRLQAHLPNGVVLRLEGAASAPQLAALVAALGALPCSA